MKTIKLRGYYVSPEPLVSRGLELLPALTPFYIASACMGSEESVYLSMLTEGLADLSKDQVYVTTKHLLRVELYELKPVGMAMDPDSLRGEVLFTNSNLDQEGWKVEGPTFWHVPMNSPTFQVAIFHPQKDYTAWARDMDPAFLLRHGYVVNDPGLQLLSSARLGSRELADRRGTLQRLERYVAGLPGDSDARAELEQILGYPVPPVVKAIQE